MKFIRTLPNGNPQIAKDLAFCALLDGKIPSKTKSFKTLFSELDQSVWKVNDQISREALSNAHGDWYEWLLAISSWNHFTETGNSNLAILLPNAHQFDISKLYVEELTNLIQDLRHKVSETSDVELISSNPDFVIISKELARETLQNNEPITTITVDTLKNLQTLYEHFIDQCQFNDIQGFIGVKTTLRPDRRLQLPHEGSLMKAIYVHLQTRQWILEPAGMKYYAMASKVGQADRDALKTVATHSITTVNSLPQAAVDDVFEVNSLQRADSVFSQILS